MEDVIFMEDVILPALPSRFVLSPPEGRVKGVHQL